MTSVFSVYCADLATYEGVGDMDAMESESRFRFFYKMGELQFGRNCGTQTLDFALHRIGQSLSIPAKTIDPQLDLSFEKFAP